MIKSSHLSLAYALCLFFFIAYSILAIGRHTHYQSFGYDLGINDQVVWSYSTFRIPVTTIDPYPDKTKFAEHVELIYIFLAPFYWLWNSPIMLILLQTAMICFSGIAVYYLAQKYHLSLINRIFILIAYLMFYGVQFGIWTDVHSSVFAAACLMWFIYFLDSRKQKLTFLFFFLTLTAKESTGTALFAISLVYFFYRREKILLLYMSLSLLYILFIFFVFFPFIMHVPYLYANKHGLLSNLNPASLIDSQEKRTAIFFSFASWGFIPLFSPIFLLPVGSHFFKFFVLASDLPGVHSIFGHYRIGIAPFLALATIVTFSHVSKRFQSLLGIFLIISVLSCQYILHLPLSYLTKQWFWHEDASIKTINSMLATFTQDTALISQNNITSHISHRSHIYTLYPEKKIFKKNSPCGNDICNWFRFEGKGQFLIVDLSPQWDIRHFLTTPPLFIDGLRNLQKAGVITLYKNKGTTFVYRINDKIIPSN